MMTGTRRETRVVLDLARADHPRLWDLIDVVTRATRSRPPAAAGLVVSTTDSVRVENDERRGLRRSSDVLMIDAATLGALSADHLGTMAALALVGTSETTTGRAPVSGASVENAEFAAACARAAWRLFCEHHLDPALRKRRRPIGVFDGFAAYVATVGIDTLLAQVRRAVPAPAPGSADSGVRALDLLDQPAEVLSRLEEQVWGFSGLEPVTFDDWANLRADQVARDGAWWFANHLAGAEPVDLAELMLGLCEDQTRQAILAGLTDQIIAAVRGGFVSEADVAPVQLLSRSIADLIGCAVVDHAGGRFVQAWPSGVTLVAAGRPVDVASAALRAALGDVEALRLLCIDHSLPIRYRPAPGSPAHEAARAHAVSSATA